MAALLSCDAAADDGDMPPPDSTVRIYGALADGYVNTSNEAGHAKNYLHSGAYLANRLGFTGVEDLGGGTRAVFTLEEGFDVNTGAMATSGSLFSRQAFVGLVNRDYGSVLLGRQYSPYYMNVGPSAVTGPLSGATGAHPGDYDGLDTDLRINNALTYVTPTAHGVSASAMVALGGGAGGSTEGDSVSAGVEYVEGRWTSGIGYLKMRNGANAAGAWDPAATANFVKSVVNVGYLSAASIEHIAAAARYSPTDRWTVGANATHSAYKPGAPSLFKNMAVLNTWGGAVTYRVSSAFKVSGGFAYTRAAAANGISDPARYRQASFEETYSLSKRVTLYGLQANTRASGQTLGAGGVGIVDAVALEGENATPSSGRSQRIVQFGVALLF